MRISAALCAAVLGGSLMTASIAAAKAEANALESLFSIGQAGSLIEATPVSGAPEGAAAFKVLYRSTGLHGESITVSGLVVVPRTAPTDEEHPIVAWAHPTTGVVSRCAPSEARIRFQMISGLRQMIQRGWVVAATDYPGLGTPETHPYLVGASEARAVLDSVRAARSIPGVGSGTRFAVWGHSQGGQAALFTGLLARSYAPDLQLVGVAAAAPATELAKLLKADLDSTGGKNLTAMTLWSWARVYGAPIDTVLDPSAIPIVDRLAQECIESIFDIWQRGRTEKPLEQRFLKVDDFAQAQPWASLLAENTPGALPPDIPVFLAQGTKDTLVRPQITRDYLRRLCRAGSAVSFDLWPDVGHGFIAAKSATHAVAWIADRFAGHAAPSSCAR